MSSLTARSSWSLVALSIASCALFLPALSATPALASDARVVVARPMPIPSTDVVLHQSSETSFDVVLAQPKHQALAAFLADLSNPASLEYHHYLSTAQFARRFGAPASAVLSVRRYLASFGLLVGSLSKGHLLLHVRGRTSNVARAFGASIVTVRRSDGVRTAQFTSPATLPATLAHDVTGVAGLSTVVPAHATTLAPRTTAHATTPGTCLSAGSSSGTTPNALSGYTVQQLAQLYGFAGLWASGHTGVGQTIGVYELGAFSPGDLTTYFGCYAINPAVTNVNVDGGVPSGVSDEATLDVEEAGSLAPGAAIRVYTGPNTNNGPLDVYQQIADDNIATIVTTSWGTCEADPSGSPSGEQPIFEQMAAQGQTVVSAAGDNGSSDCNGVTTNAPAVDDPASQPYVTGVGGLTVSNISPLTQRVWNDGSTSGGGGAGGGGVSQLWSRPAWQNAPGIAATVTMRLVPDLSVVADPATGFIQYFSGTGTGVCHTNCGGGWSSIGGTSIGAPLVSALVAVAAQNCGVARLGFINPALYAMATTGFNDVTAGTNDLFGVGSYSAGVGYDSASGLGSPNAKTFAAGLCPLLADPVNSSLVSGAASAIVNTNTSVTLNVRDANHHPVVNAVVKITARATNGSVVIDNDHSSMTGTGTAAYGVTTNANGAAIFTVYASAPGTVKLSATLNATTIATTTLTFANHSSKSLRPATPKIARLVGVVGGFTLRVGTSPPRNGHPVTAYQYSTDGGATWSSFSAKTRVVTTTKLIPGKLYHVIVRALNADGPSAPSAPSSVTTRR